MDMLKKLAPLILVAVGILGASGQMQGCSFDFKQIIPIPIIDTVDPAKTAGSWVLVVEETGQRDAATAAVLQDFAFWQSLAGRGLKHQRYDQTDVPHYVAVLQGIGMPALLVLSPDGAVLGKERLPLTIAEVDAAIKKATGR